MKKSVTILVPAYDEEKNLNDTVNNINSALKDFISDYEILVFDDCSKDRTGEIADKLAKIPMYLSKSIQNACAVDAVNIAGKIENEQAYSFARKLAYSQQGAMPGRSYYGRPSAY